MNDEEEDGEAIGLRRQLRFAIQNLQFAARSKGIELGPVSAQQILDMAERGELDEISAAVDGVRAVLNGCTALLAYVKEDRRVCPKPIAWSHLFDLLPNKNERVGGGWEPPPPLILAAWHRTSDREKRERLLLHIRWAADHGAFEQVNDFIRAIPPGEWHRYAI